MTRYATDPLCPSEFERDDFSIECILEEDHVGQHIGVLTWHNDQSTVEKDDLRPTKPGRDV